MRDDVPGLTFIRMLPAAQTPLARPTSSRASNFATALKRATGARAPAGHTLERYSSPLKESSGARASNRIQKPPSLRPAPQNPLATTRPAGTPQRAPSLPLPPPTRPAPTRDSTSSDTATPNIPWSLDAYPHPNRDNGRGMHWIPTTQQSPAAIDKFVAEAQRMGVKWVTFLNKGASIGDNDYLVKKLVGAGIEPVMRLYTPTLEPIQGDVEGMVRHYVAMGVHYFQPFNEPNLNLENPDGQVSVDRYLNAWIPAARAILAGGGLPGFGSMAPGGDFDDQRFLEQALAGIKSRGQTGLLERAWLSMHNYTWNHPIHDRGDGDGFFKFRAYHRIVQQALGRDLPIIGTEGGTFTGEQEDPNMDAVTPEMAADWTRQAFNYMHNLREPWLFASSVWTIADLAGGGSDPRFEAQALIKADGTVSSVATALETLG